MSSPFSAGSLDLSELVAKLNAASDAVKDAASRGLGNAAEHVLGEAVKVVPIEEGMLQDSGRTEVDGLVAGIGFGHGPSAAYAVRQHEDTTLRHDAGRTSHFLSGPLAAERDAVLKIVGGEIEGVL